MNAVSIDTVFSGVSVTASGKKGKYTSHFLPAQKQRAEELTLFIQEAVKNAGFLPSETELIVCPEGPGSFTGLRLGYAAAKAVQLKTNAEFISVPVFAAVDFMFNFWSGQILGIADAKRNRFYGQLFYSHKAKTEVFDLEAEKICEYIDISENCLVAGFGISEFRKYIENLACKDRFFFVEVPQNSFSETVLNYVLSGKTKKIVADYGGPVYIRKSDAEKV